MDDPKTPGHLAPSGDVTIFEVTELRHTLQTWLTAHDAVTLDLTDVRHIDASGLQLLIAAHRTGRCSLQGLSVKSREDLRRFGWESDERGAR